MGKSSKKKGEGFHSAAGLIRYFDAEDQTALKIDPWYVIGFSVIMACAVILANILWR